MTGYAGDTFNLLLTAILIILNAFFVAAEFALVKVNKSKIRGMQSEKMLFADIAMWLYKRQSMALSACQMGITMASLALGWIGEPALAHLIKPLLEGIGITSESLLHGVAFAIAFSLITSLHIVIGEQFPKIYAIRKPIPVVGWTAYPLKFFYILFFPFMWVLDKTTARLLRMVGIESDNEHEAILTEEEIRASLSIAHKKGDLSKFEHQLLDSAFKFDDLITRQIMLPRSEVVFFDLDLTIDFNLQVAKDTKHTRFPICHGSLDKIEGVIHIKDFVGTIPKDNSFLSGIARKALYIPENLPISKLMQEFKQSKQHFGFVQDEYGNVKGIVTMEHVLEQLVGSVQDEFDSELPNIIKESEGNFLIEGSTLVEEVNQTLNLLLETDKAETFSGLLVEKTGRFSEEGQMLNLEGGLIVKVIEIKNGQASKIKLTIPIEKNKVPIDVL